MYVFIFICIFVCVCMPRHTANINLCSSPFSLHFSRRYLLSLLSPSLRPSSSPLSPFHSSSSPLHTPSFVRSHGLLFFTPRPPHLIHHLMCRIVDTLCITDDVFHRDYDALWMVCGGFWNDNVSEQQVSHVILYVCDCV